MHDCKCVIECTNAGEYNRWMILSKNSVLPYYNTVFERLLSGKGLWRINGKIKQFKLCGLKVIGLDWRLDCYEKPNIKNHIQSAILV